MTITLTPPSGPLTATVSVPGSKSVANRALVCAALADGTSTISGLPQGDDVAVIVSALEESGSLHRLAGDAIAVNGRMRPVLPGIVDAKLAGTSSRFLTALAAVSEGTTVIDGATPLRSRPMGQLHDALVEMGGILEPLGNPGYLPVSVTGSRIVGGQVALRGDVSSQFVSALMLIAPVLEGGLRIEIAGTLVSRSYVDMTARVMRDFGAEVTVDESVVDVLPTGYRPVEYSIEPDYSSAAFPLGALLLREGTVRILGLARSSMQGDSRLLDLLRSAGVDVTVDGEDIVGHRVAARLTGLGRVDMADCSDLVPPIAVGVAVCEGTTVIDRIGFIRHKESDRVHGLVERLQLCGAHAVAHDDDIEIVGTQTLVPATIDTAHDHRIAMAFALSALSSGSVTLVNPEVVSKSWPRYFTDMEPILGPPRADH